MIVTIENKSYLNVDGVTVAELDYLVSECLVIDGVIVLLQLILNKKVRTDRNVFCYNKSGELLWQFESHKSTEGFWHVGLREEQGNIVISNFTGRHFLVNPKTGDVINEWDTR